MIENFRKRENRKKLTLTIDAQSRTGDRLDGRMESRVGTGSDEEIK